MLMGVGCLDEGERSAAWSITGVWGESGCCWMLPNAEPDPCEKRDIRSAVAIPKLRWANGDGQRVSNDTQCEDADSGRRPNSCFEEGDGCGLKESRTSSAFFGLRGRLIGGAALVVTSSASNASFSAWGSRTLVEDAAPTADSLALPSNELCNIGDDMLLRMRLRDGGETEASGKLVASAGVLFHGKEDCLCGDLRGAGVSGAIRYGVSGRSGTGWNGKVRCISFLILG